MTGTERNVPTGAPQREYVIENTTVKLPLEVRDARSISATFLVPTAAVRRLVDLPRLEVAELWPRRTLCSIAGIEYRDNDLGSYNEVGVAFFVRPAGERRLPLVGTALDLVRGRLGAYIHRLPVTTSLSCEAGRRIWGFPKFVAEIAFREEGPHRSVTLVADGEHVLTLSVACGKGQRSYQDASFMAYSGLEGVARSIPFVSSGSEVGMRLGGATLELGPHPLADELRTLGLPRRALTSARVAGMQMRFDAAREL